MSGDAEEQSQAASNAEHQRVFNYMPPRAGVFNPKKKKSASSKKGKGKLQSCTLKFFCLSKVHSEKPPNSVFEKTALSNCGLGPGSITLDVNSTASDVHHNLLEKYPLLQVGGGYELLLYQRGGTEQGFHNIPAPYTPAKIKELAGQAQVYIRPLQKDLDDIQETEIPCSAVKVSNLFPSEKVS